MLFRRMVEQRMRGEPPVIDNGIFIPGRQLLGNPYTERIAPGRFRCIGALAENLTEIVRD